MCGGFVQKVWVLASAPTTFIILPPMVVCVCVYRFVYMSFPMCAVYDSATQTGDAKLTRLILSPLVKGLARETINNLHDTWE